MPYCVCTQKWRKGLKPDAKVVNLDNMHAWSYEYSPEASLAPFYLFGCDTASSGDGGAAYGAPS